MIFPDFSGSDIRRGEDKEEVTMIKDCMNIILAVYPISDMIYDEKGYGAKTERAVKRFQAIMNLDETGTVDNKTWDAMFAVANLLRSS